MKTRRGSWFAMAATILLISPTIQAQGTPKASDYPAPKPAFAGQTNAPAPKSESVYKVEVLTPGPQKFNLPWSFAFLPDGKILVTELSGTMRTLRKDRVISAPIAGLPDVKTIAAQGLHDLALDPNFDQNRLVYFTYFAPPSGEDPAIWPNTPFYSDVYDKSVAERRRKVIGFERVARATLSADDKKLGNVQFLLEGVERRVVFAPDGTLLICGADRFRFYDSGLGGPDHEITDPDVLRNFTGRVVRINPDGTIPADNPFLDEPAVLPETFSYGHRDPEGMAINPATGELWLDEHGPMGGDEVNIVRAGRNYGWPNVSYGRQYTGAPVARDAKAKEGITTKEGTEQPVYYWYPDIAPSGMMFYTGDLFPQWKGNLFIGALAGKFLVRLILDGNKVISEEHLLIAQGERIRDVRQGPEGAVYVLTESGAILRLLPKN
jgi:glucose/arabinose dehydrogenase